MNTSRQAACAATAARLLIETAGFSVLLFATRFLLRAHLVPLMDQECHIGGIALDVLGHGVRFPLLVYAPNEYDNGSFFSGLLTVVSFRLLGRSVLALKLVTHVISAMGAVAALWLLRECVDEANLTTRRARLVGTVALVIAFGFATRLVTLTSMYAVGNHAEGSAIDVILLALFAGSFRAPTRSGARVAALWALVGFALYVNKGTLLVLPILGSVEVVLAWRARRRIAAALAGFAAGVCPELSVVLQRHGVGWTVMAGKAEHNAPGFPRAFCDSILTLADHRPELLLAWALAVAAGTVLLVRATRRRRRSEVPANVPPAPIALAMMVGVVAVHVLALTVMAQGGLDSYAVYSYPALAILFALTLASVVERVSRWNERIAPWSAVAAIALTLVLHRPDRIAWGGATVSALWRNEPAAACSWRFAEGFEREQRWGLAAPGTTREQHAIERCRSLSDQDQILDCIGGIARELNWREDGRVPGEPPAGLSTAERHAYAYYWGTHRMGKTERCSDFDDPELAADCTGAAELECLVFTDVLMRVASGEGIAQPQCRIPVPPMDGYWASMRRELLARPPGNGPTAPAASSGDEDLRDCEPILRACYPPSS